MKEGVSVLQLANISKRTYLDRDLSTEFGSRRLDYRGYYGGGFFGCLYRVNNKLVVSFRGTDAIGDVRPDAQMLFGNIPNQYYHAKSWVAEIMSSGGKPKGINYLTGHSLGGGIAQMIGAELGIPFVTFNAPGTKRSYKDLGKGVPRIQSDISMSHFKKRISRGSTLPMYAKWLNVRANGDPVSRATGAHIGDVVSIPAYCGHGHYTHWFWSSNYKKIKETSAKALHQHSINNLEPATAVWSSFKVPLNW